MEYWIIGITALWVVCIYSRIWALTHPLNKKRIERITVGSLTLELLVAPIMVIVGLLIETAKITIWRAKS